MKILRVEQLRSWDAYTIAHEPIASVDLMERAALACTQWITTNISSEKKIHIFCGKGNNGGDGLAIARLLTQHSYNVDVYIADCFANSSDDFKTNLSRLKNTGVRTINSVEGINISDDDIVVDALLGSGLSRKPDGLLKEIIEFINKTKSFKIAVDVPSGLHPDAVSDNVIAVKATITLTFQQPKLSFFFSDHSIYTGDFVVLDIGLKSDYLSDINVSEHYLTRKDLAELYKRRHKFSHKGTYGHALIIAGSTGKCGAAMLSARSSLKSGAGLVTLHAPQCCYNPVQTSIPEVMFSTDSGQDYIKDLARLESFDAIGFGPGVGDHKDVATVLKRLIQECTVPLVIDADGINILSENKTWLSFLPANTILTPHPGEFDRLIGRKIKSGFERWNYQKEFSQKHNIICILKGAHTSIALPGGETFFNSTGNPGMATAGSGDVLTGIITGLLAQGYDAGQAAKLGVYLHGLSADLALDYDSYESLTAGVIIQHLGLAFKSIAGNGS